MRRHGFLLVFTAVVVAVSGWMLSQVTELGASEEPVRSYREVFRSGQTSADQPHQDGADGEAGIRLNYFESSWDRVLRNVAEQAQLSLVMDRVPSGRYARRDRNRYDFDTVLRILNTELEQQGFRLIRQGQFLVVLNLEQARTRYARPTIGSVPSSTEVESQWKPMDTASNIGRISAVSARNDGNGPRIAWASNPQDGSTDGGSKEPDNAQGFGGQVVPRPAADTAEVEQPRITREVDVHHGKAADVARKVYLAFESRAELVREGLAGLPTFVVYAEEKDSVQGAEGREVLFQVGINQQENQLVVDGPQQRVDHLLRLISELDKARPEDETTVHLVPNKGVNDVTARDLNEQIHRMVAMQAATPPTGAPENGTVGSSQDGSLNLRGEVNVQAMQELGILIIKGNEVDVQKVEGIIKQLEQLSVGSLPDIHLLALTHISSEAMAELMTSVYEELSELRQRNNETRKTAAFIPVVQPNAILILSSSIELEAILKLADQLDQKLDPNAEFRVFSLRSAIASQVVESLEGFYEERGGLGTRARVIADVRTNAVIVQGRSNDLEEIAKVIEGLDRDTTGSVHRVEIIQLKHATAEELAAVISTAIQSVTSPPQQTTTGGGFGLGQNQGAQELRDGKSVALEFLATGGTGHELVRSGILVDVRVNADIRSNSLVVSAPEASMPLLKALIRELDKAPAAVSEIKVFALKNADAEQSVELLTAMFENQNQESQLGIQIAGTEDSVSSLVPVSFSADLRTNTVLAVGSAESLLVVEAILLRLDTTDSRQRTTNVVALRNAPASVVATALESFLQQQQALQDSSADLISNIERLRQEVIIAADDNSNSLIISASPEYYSQISRIVNELDATPPQVVIQALLVEVQLDNTDEFGVELGFQDPTLFGRSILQSTADIVSTTNITQAANGQQIQQTVIQSQNKTPGFNFNNTAFPLGNNSVGDSSIIGTQGLSNFSLGRQNTDLGFGGFVFSAQSDAVSVLVRALAARRTVHVLSRPQIRTTHNNVASIQVGQQVPVVDGVTVTNNFVTPTITQENVGIILTVTPRVTPDGIVNMDVYAEKSALASGGVPVFTDAASGNVVESVIIDTAIADTTVAVPNGQTIVIGGMITKSDETLERKVPWLGDLPLVGSLFRYDGTNTARTELLVFLTPRIVYGDLDSELIKQVETERLHFIESEAEEIHGPLYGVPGEQLNELRLRQFEQQGVPMDVELPVLPPGRSMDPVLQTPAVPGPPASGDSTEIPQAKAKASGTSVDDKNGNRVTPASGITTDRPSPREAHSENVRNAVHQTDAVASKRGSTLSETNSAYASSRSQATDGALKKPESQERSEEETTSWVKRFSRR
ncbi:MAG: hypothetical protein KDA81_00870 [Planctomycetaceae bacterium]|nr:hypothetical protein [Planctomycetaceae bacterium]